MRILQVAPFFSPQMGGSAQVIYQISKHLSERGHQVSLIAGDFGIQHAHFPLGDDFEVHLLPSVISKWGFYFTPGLIPWAKKHLHCFDLVHLHELRTFQNVVVKHYSAFYEIPYVLSAHGTLPHIIQRKLAKQIFDRCFGKSLLSHASCLIAVSESEARQYKALHLPEDRVCLLYNGLDLREFRNLPAKGRFRKRFGIAPESSKIILYVGRLHRRKGLMDLLTAFAALKSNCDDYFLVIVGPDEGELSPIRRYIARLKISSRVLITGPLYGVDKLAAMLDADVLAYPSGYEIFGLVPFEALMCGTPVVVSDDCGMGELIGRAEAGYLVPYGDPRALAKTLEQAITHWEASIKRVRAGRTFIQEWLDWNRVIVDLENIYLAVLCDGR